MSTATATTDKLLEFKTLITEKLYAALTDPKRPVKAATVNAAIQWLRITGNIEDHDARFRQRPGALGDLADKLPFLTEQDKAMLREADEDREKLAASVQHAVENMSDDEDDGDSDGNF